MIRVLDAQPLLRDAFTQNHVTELLIGLRKNVFCDFRLTPPPGGGDFFWPEVDLVKHSLE